MSEQDPALPQREQLSIRESGWKAAELFDLYTQALANCPEFMQALAAIYFSNDGKGGRREGQIPFLMNGFSYDVEIQRSQNLVMTQNPEATKRLTVVRHSPVWAETVGQPEYIALFVGPNNEWGTISHGSGDFEDIGTEEDGDNSNTFEAVEVVKSFLSNFKTDSTPATEATN